MIYKKNQFIIALTTFDKRMLKISMSAIKRLGKKNILIIHNDNTDVKISKFQIRKLGYWGKLYIINTDINKGLFQSRIRILNKIKQLGIKSKWMIFVEDDDLLKDIKIPKVNNDKFAIIQNTIIIKRKITDLFKVMENPDNYTIDNYNITVLKPNTGIAGTILKTSIMLEFSEFLAGFLDEIKLIDDSLEFREPADFIMWTYLQMYTSHTNPVIEPIYMDRTNYITINLDTSDKKYGKYMYPPRNNPQYYEVAIERYKRLLDKKLKESDNEIQ